MRRLFTINAVVLGVLGALVVGCFQVPGPMPGMAPRPATAHGESPTTLDELARVEPDRDHRALLVVYPRSACSGSARQIFMDTRGRYFGAVAPGEAALLAIPKSVHTLTVVSAVEIASPTNTYSFGYDEIRLAPPPSGIILRSIRVDARRCGSGQYSDAITASKAELEAAIAAAYDGTGIQWLEPRIAEGQAWLDARRERRDEVLGLKELPPAKAVTHVVR